MMYTRTLLIPYIYTHIHYLYYIYAYTHTYTEDHVADLVVSGEIIEYKNNEKKTGVLYPRYYSLLYKRLIVIDTYF